MGKGSRIRKERAAKRKQEAAAKEAAAHAASGLFGIQARGGPFGAAPPWKQPNSLDEAMAQLREFMKAMPQLIVCGRVGLEPLTIAQRRELLSGVNLFDALETIARLQGRWGWSPSLRHSARTSSRPTSSPAATVRRADRRASWSHRTKTYSRPPRATAQLQREIIEYASTDDTAPAVDRNTLVHMLLSVTTEQNLDQEFAGDVATEAEIARLERELPKMGLKEMLEYSQRLIPDEVASNLFNMPSKYEMVLSDTHDVWFAPSGREIQDDGAGRDPRRSVQDRHRRRIARRPATWSSHREAQRRHASGQVHPR